MVPCPPDFSEKLEQSATHGCCVEFKRPEETAKAVWLRSQGMSIKKIAVETGLHFNTLRNLFWRQDDTIETKKKEFSRRYAQIAEMAGDCLSEKLERLIEDPAQLDAISPDRLALTIGILTDHAAKLSGMAGVVIEHRRGTSIDDAKVAIAAARARIAEKTKDSAIEAEIIDFQSEKTDDLTGESDM